MDGCVELFWCHFPNLTSINGLSGPGFQRTDRFAGIDPSPPVVNASRATAVKPDHDPLGRELRGYHFLAVLKMEMQATATARIAGCVRKRVEEEIVVVY